MANGKINNASGVASTTPEIKSNTISSLHGYCIKKDGLVYIGLNIVGSHIPGSATALLQLPSGFRPKNQATLPGVMYREDSEKLNCFEMTIKVNGEIVNGYSGALSSQMQFTGVFKAS